jgi:hypothetical protein
MLQHHTFLIIIIMIGSLCAFLWDSHPQDSLQRSQAERVYNAVTVSFH